MPGILEDPDHHKQEVAALGDDASPADLRAVLDRLGVSSERVADYGRALWQQLTVVADYLREDVAHGPAGAGLTSEQRQRWQDVYAKSLFVLAGPRGDSGYAVDQARLEVRAQTEDLPAT